MIESLAPVGEIHVSWQARHRMRLLCGEVRHNIGLGAPTVILHDLLCFFDHRPGGCHTLVDTAAAAAPRLSALTVGLSY